MSHGVGKGPARPQHGDQPGQEGRITVSVNGLSPAACATASFTSFLKIAASFAAGRPVDLSAVGTNSLGWAHARRVAEAVTTTDGPPRPASARPRRRPGRPAQPRSWRVTW